MFRMKLIMELGSMVRGSWVLEKGQRRILRMRLVLLDEKISSAEVKPETLCPKIPKNTVFGDNDR